MKRIISFLLVFLVTLLPLGCANPNDTSSPPTTQQIIVSKQSCLVQIDAYGLEGSGVIASLNSTSQTIDIITNYHVVVHAIQSSKPVYVRFFNTDDFIQSQIVGYIKSYDICVLRVTAPTDSLTSINIDNPTPANMAQQAYALGYNEGKIGAYDGIISSTNKLINATNIEEYIYATQTTVPFLNGCSGGLLINENGDFVGILSYALISLAGYTGITYAIDAQIASSAYMRIVSSTSVLAKPLTGFVINFDGTVRVNAGDLNFTITPKSSGIIVTQSTLQFPKLNQKITKINGKDINSAQDLTIFLSEIIKTYDQTILSCQ